MKELLTALINSNNESGKYNKYLYEKYCKLLYEVDYGNKIYESEELFTDFIKYIFDRDILISCYSTCTIIKFKKKDRATYYQENIQKGASANSIITTIRGAITYLGLEQDKNSNLNTLKNVKIH